jgi:hypothetical protein
MDDIQSTIQAFLLMLWSWEIWLNNLSLKATIDSIRKVNENPDHFRLIIIIQFNDQQHVSVKQERKAKNKTTF